MKVDDVKSNANEISQVQLSFVKILTNQSRWVDWIAANQ